MAFSVESVKESPALADGATPALPHVEMVVGGGLPSSDSTATVVIGQQLGQRVLKESTKKLLAGMAATPAPEASAATPIAAPAPSVAPVQAPPGPTDAPAAVSAVATPASPTATTTTAAAVADDVAARAARLAEYNSRLVAENEQYKKSIPPADVMERIKAQDELDRLWVTDPATAYAKQMSRLLGVPEDHKDINQHAQLFELDLTKKRTGVQLTDDSEAAGKAARTLAAIQLEMRARKADEIKPPTPQDDPAEKDIGIVAQHIAETKLADKYPLLMSLTEHDYGVKPERLLWNRISHGLQTGELDPRMTYAQAIDVVAPDLESRYEAQYQARMSKYNAAKRPSVSAQAASAEEKKPDPPSSVVPTLTNASASVAPATPPAQPAANKKASYQSEQQRRIDIIRQRTVRG